MKECETTGASFAGKGLDERLERLDGMTGKMFDERLDGMTGKMFDEWPDGMTGRNGNPALFVV